jgi:iron-sulfur cluster assembly protein
MDQISGSASSSSSGAPVVPAVITISEKAAAQVRVIQQKENKLNSFLRVSVVGGGCSGLSYKLSFEDAPKEKDKILN